MSRTVSESLRTHYDAYYGSDRLTQWRRLGARDKAANVVRLCSAVPHDSILDIGCGDGAILERLDELEFGRRYFAVDVSRSAIESLRCKSIGRLVSAEVFDGDTIPYQDRFDVAVLSHVVEHLEYPRRIIREAARVARHVFIEVPLEHTIRLKHDYIPEPVGHINWYTDVTIRRLVQTCELEVLAQFLTHSSVDLFRFKYGRPKGVVLHAAFRTGLLLAPGLAKYVLSYHAALLCRPKV